MGKINESFFRHGDVYILRTSMRAETIRRGTPNFSAVLAYGEATGHKHELQDITAFERYEIDGRTYLIVNETGVSIDHAEHGLGFIEPGTYEVRIDREYDYLSDMARNSID